MGTSFIEKSVKIEKKHDFPIVVKSTSSDLIVLFSSEKEGTAIVSGSSATIGYHTSAWESCFKTEYWQILDSVTITFKS